MSTKKQLNVSLPLPDYSGLVERARAAGQMRHTEYATELLKKDLIKVRRQEFAVMTMESACYFMNADLQVTDANLAAAALFEMRQPYLKPIEVEELVEILKRALTPDSFEREHKHFTQRFDKRAMIDESPAEARMEHRVFGEVKLHRRGVRLPDHGWSVVWNLRSVQRDEQFQQDLQSRIEAWRRGVDS